MKCPHCDESLDDDWNCRRMFLKHISNCLDKELNSNKFPTDYLERLYTMFTLLHPGWNKFYSYNTHGIASFFKINPELFYFINRKEVPTELTPEAEIIFIDMHGLFKKETIEDKTVYQFTERGLEVQELVKRDKLEPFSFCKMDEGDLFMYHPFVRFVYRQREGLTKELYKELEAFPLFKLEKIHEHN